MKPTQTVLIIIGVLSLTSVLTNPTLDAHKKAVLAKMEEKMGESDTYNSTNKWDEVGRNIGMSLAQNIIDKAVERSNYQFFSLTKLRFGDKAEQIGFGAFGKVWITNEYPNPKTGFSNSEESSATNETTNFTTTTTSVHEEYDFNQNLNNKNENEPNTKLNRDRVGLYIANGINTNRIYFHNAPDKSTRRRAYIMTEETVYVQKIENNFGYVQFANTKGQTTSGWIEMQYLTDTYE